MNDKNKIIMDDYDAGYSDGYNIGYEAGLVAYAQKLEKEKQKKCCGGGCHAENKEKSPKKKSVKSNKK